MGVRDDFHSDLERSAGLLMDATCAARCAVAGPVPRPHREIVARAVRRMEQAQQDLFMARNDPWSHRPTKAAQLELL